MIPEKLLKYLPRLLSLFGLLFYAASAAARQPNAAPEPSMLALIGLGVVVAILAKRFRDGK